MARPHDPRAVGTRLEIRSLALLLLLLAVVLVAAPRPGEAINMVLFLLPATPAYLLPPYSANSLLLNQNAYLPNINFLSSTSLIFDRVYANIPRSAPSRLSMLTSLLPRRQLQVMTDMYNLPSSSWVFRTDRETVLPDYLATVLPKNARTAGFGRIFPSNDDTRKFANFGLFFPSDTLGTQDAYCPNDPGLASPVPPVCSVPYETSLTEDYLSSRSVQTIRTAARDLKSGKISSFFITVGFYRPLGDLSQPNWARTQAEGAYRNLFTSALNTVVPPAAMAPHPMAQLTTPLIAPTEGTLASLDVVNTHIGLAGTLQWVDFTMGKIIDELRGLQLYDDTIMILTSDTGLATGEYSSYGQGTLFEHGTRVPLMIRHPQLPFTFNVRSGALIQLTDLFPTLLDLLSLPQPDTSSPNAHRTPLDGVSFRGLFDLAPSFYTVTARHAAFTEVGRCAVTPMVANQIYTGSFTDCGSLDPTTANPDVIGISMRTADYRYTEWRAADPGGVVKWDASSLWGRELYAHTQDTGVSGTSGTILGNEFELVNLAPCPSCKMIPNNSGRRALLMKSFRARHSERVLDQEDDVKKHVVEDEESLEEERRLLTLIRQESTRRLRRRRVLEEGENATTTNHTSTPLITASGISMTSVVADPPDLPSNPILAAVVRSYAVMLQAASNGAPLCSNHGAYDPITDTCGPCDAGWRGVQCEIAVFPEIDPNAPPTARPTFQPTIFNNGTKPPVGAPTAPPSSVVISGPGVSPPPTVEPLPKSKQCVTFTDIAVCLKYTTICMWVDATGACAARSPTPRPTTASPHPTAPPTWPTPAPTPYPTNPTVPTSQSPSRPPSPLAPPTPRPTLPPIMLFQGQCSDIPAQGLCNKIAGCKWNGANQGCVVPLPTPCGCAMALDPVEVIVFTPGSTAAAPPIQKVYFFRNKCHATCKGYGDSIVAAAGDNLPSTSPTQSPVTPPPQTYPILGPGQTIKSLELHFAVDASSITGQNVFEKDCKKKKGDTCWGLTAAFVDSIQATLVGFVTGGYAGNFPPVVDYGMRVSLAAYSCEGGSQSVVLPMLGGGLSGDLKAILADFTTFRTSLVPSGGRCPLGALQNVLAMDKAGDSTKRPTRAVLLTMAGQLYPKNSYKPVAAVAQQLRARGVATYVLLMSRRQANVDAPGLSASDVLIQKFQAFQIAGSQSRIFLTGNSAWLSLGTPLSDQIAQTILNVARDPSLLNAAVESLPGDLATIADQFGDDDESSAVVVGVAFGIAFTLGAAIYFVKKRRERAWLSSNPFAEDGTTAAKSSIPPEMTVVGWSGQDYQAKMNDSYGDAEKGDVVVVRDESESRVEPPSHHRFSQLRRYLSPLTGAWGGQQATQQQQPQQQLQQSSMEDAEATAPASPVKQARRRGSTERAEGRGFGFHSLLSSSHLPTGAGGNGNGMTTTMNNSSTNNEAPHITTMSIHPMYGHLE